MHAWRFEMVPFTQLWTVASLAAGLILLLALVLLCQQLRISGLRSARVDLLKRVEAFQVDQRDHLHAQFEMQAALRAERAHVEQLERKVLLLKAAIEDESLQSARRHT